MSTGSHPTRTSRLRRSVDAAWAAGDVVVLTGPGVGDVFMTDGEAARLARTIARWGLAHGCDTLLWSLPAGPVVMAPPGHTPAVGVPPLAADTPPSVALDACVAAAGASERPVVVVIDHSEGILPDIDHPDLDHARLRGQILDLATHFSWIQAGHRLVLIARSSGVDRRLTGSPGIRCLTVDLPDLAERQQHLEAMAESGTKPLILELPVTRAATLTGGLLLHDQARLRDANNGALTEDHIVSAKQAVIQRTSRGTLHVNVDRPDLDRDVAGLPQIRLALAEESHADNPTLRWILAGPPGTGKTFCAAAVGTRLGVPVLSLGAILERWVGASEANMDTALGVIQAMAPVLVIVDEADQAGFGRRGREIGGDGGSQVSAALRGRLLTYLGDPAQTNGISWVLLTNRPDILDEAVLSRMTVLPVLHPTPEELTTVMALQARRDRIEFDLEGVAAVVQQRSPLMSGRDAAKVAQRGALLARGTGRQRITGPDIDACLDDARFRLGPMEELQALIALRETTWGSHLPWNAAATLGDAMHVPRYLSAMVRGGKLDDDALDRRIAELQAMS